MVIWNCSGRLVELNYSNDTASDGLKLSNDCGWALSVQRGRMGLRLLSVDVSCCDDDEEARWLGKLL
ncbi:hypothetical protein M0R45_028381 [Rubus argutus]|uniref:Uncharacterized protein n=1 Tax=Rubus argutus TaxID=59490 RepID=A0AAW1W787_RUBAR